MTILSTKKQANERDNRKDETTSQHNHSSHRLSTSSSTVTTNTRSRQSIDDVQNQQQQQQQQLSGTSQTETDESSSSLLNTSTCKRKARSSPHRSTRRQRGNNNSNNNNNNNNASGSQSSGSNGVTGSNTPTSCNSSGNLVQQQHTTMQQQHLSSSSSSNYRWTKDMPCSSTTHIDYDENSQCNSEDEYEQTTFKYDKNNLNDLEMRFVRALKEKKSFVIKAIKEDGACLFRAVADQVLGDEDLHDTVRQNCMDYIVKNADFFRNYITEDFDHYVSRKRKHNCHGNHIEMIALSELYNRPIEVYEYSTEPINTVHGMYKTDNEPIRLSYHCGVHYNSVIDPWKPVPLDRGSIAQNTLIQNTIRQSEESHIEQAMLDDKIMATDWEATQDELIQQVARESYLEWVCETEQQRNKDKSMPSSSYSVTTSGNGIYSLQKTNEDAPPKNPLPLRLDERKDCEFALPFHYDNGASASTNIDLDDDESLLKQVLAISQFEYIEELKKSNQTTHSGEANVSTVPSTSTTVNNEDQTEIKANIDKSL